MDGMREEIQRKSFHLLALGYVAALYVLPRPLYLFLLAGMFGIVGGVEWLRLHRPAVNDWFFAHFGGLFRAHERTRLTGLFWMLAGVMVCVLVSRTKAAAATAILYTVLGDGIASLVGKRVQGPRWPNSPKSFSGSTACFLVCAGIGWSLLRPDMSWAAVLGAALLATVVEVGPIPLDDNFSVPVLTGLFLRFF